VFLPGEEGKTMKKAIAGLMLLAGGLFAAPQFRVGIGFGAPAPVAVARPVCPGPGYTWVDGYYASNGVWVGGYWAPPVVRVAPRYERLERERFEHARYYDRDRFDRDHRSDGDRHSDRDRR
jgi:hypothetical protein